jgi:16S rRNA (guanine527-N7)-methyltransferase
MSPAVGGPPAPAPPDAAAAVFGQRFSLAVRYAGLLAGSGVERGLIGPREAERIWQRHVLNCAVIGEVVPAGAGVVDVGSGAGLPGIPLALARPDLRITLLEPLARRVAWLTEVIGELGISVPVHRGRAEDAAVRSALGGCDVVTARAVAPMGRLAGWTLPLLRPGGLLVAMKGATAGDEVASDRAAIRGSGGHAIRLHDCGSGIVDPLTRVVLVERRVGARIPRGRAN